MTSLAEVVIAALAEVAPARLVRRAVARGLPFACRDGLVVVAFGKASAAMFDGASEALGDAIRRAVVVVPAGASHPPSRRGLVVREGAHPLPDRSSVAAAKEVERLLRRSELPALALVSGGASSLLGWPNEGISLQKKRQIVARLLASGAPIGDVNLVRRHLSRVKGGGLLRALGSRPMHSLIVSDVVDGRASDVGSGPTVPSPFSVAQASRVATKWLGPHALPLRPGVGKDDPAARLASHATLVSPRSFARRVARGLERDGLRVTAPRIRTFALEELAATLVTIAERLAPREAVVIAAEPTLALPPGTRGRGGRASHLALVVGPRLPSGVELLALATDGVDGTSGHAGALVTSASFRGQVRAAARACAGFDSGTFARTLGAHVEVPRGHNLTDVIVLARR